MNTGFGDASHGCAKEGGENTNANTLVEHMAPFGQTEGTADPQARHKTFGLQLLDAAAAKPTL